MRDHRDDYEKAGARVLGADGKVAAVLPKVRPKQHDELVLKALSELAA